MNDFNSEEENKSTNLPNRKNSESLYLDVDYNVESKQPVKKESVISQSRLVRLGLITSSKQMFLIFNLSLLAITMITGLLLTSNIRGATVFVKVMTQDGKYINNAKITFLNKKYSTSA